MRGGKRAGRAGDVRARWRALPRWARWTGAVYVIGFAEGTAAHWLDLARGGIHVYAAFATVPLQVFFVGLAVLDPLTVAWVGLVRPAGIRWAAVVMTLDVAANWCVNWPLLVADPTWVWRPVGLLPITLFGLFVVGTAVPLLRAVGAVRGRLDCASR
ncbi:MULTISPECIES: hypothetical protein [Streptomyces]|uniref:hypothetical protein n=1 Tax=Streptomyces TaxID=1883 RepID=UPI002F25EE73